MLEKQQKSKQRLAAMQNILKPEVLITEMLKIRNTRRAGMALFVYWDLPVAIAG
jgi:hypothetical protein